jgi:hypothetical protein
MDDDPDSKPNRLLDLCEKEVNAGSDFKTTWVKASSMGFELERAFFMYLHTKRKQNGQVGRS